MESRGNIQFKIVLVIIFFLCLIIFMPSMSFATVVDGVEYSISNDGSNKMYVSGCDSNLESAVIQSEVSGREVKAIGKNAFYGCSNLSNIIIPAGIETIGDSAFSGCSNLSNITIPYGVKTIGLEAFKDCIKLTEIDIPDSVTKMTELEGWNILTYKNGATFSNCTSLQKVRLSSNMTAIPSQSFKGCTSLTDISIPNSITTIYYQAFYGCSNLKRIEIPNNVELIMGGAFEGCTNLEYAKMPAKTNFSETTTIGSNYNWPIFVNCPNLTLDIVQDSPSEIYAINNNINYTIYAYPIEKVSINEIKEYRYTGLEIKPEIIIKHKDKTLEEGIDYTVLYTNNTNAGIATVTVTGIGKYIGTKTVNFTIKKAEYDMSNVIFDNLTVTYDGKGHSVCVSGFPEGVNVEYENNGKTDVGEYTVTASFTGDTTNFELIEDKKATLKIEPKSIANVTITGNVNKVYTGSQIKPSILVKDGSKILKNGTDYIVSYKNNINTGKATIVVTGKGNYTLTKTVTFNIIPSQAKGLKAKTQKEKEITLQWSKNGGGVTGYEIFKYNSSKSKWDYIGSTSNTYYTVKSLSAGTAYIFKVKAYKTIDGAKNFGSYSTTIKISTLPTATKIKKITTKSKKATVKWNKVTGATGYEIYMSKNKNSGYSKIKTITKGSTISYTKGSLIKNKKYYFKIRTYRTVDGKKLYSSYSAVKQIKVK